VIRAFTVLALLAAAPLTAQEFVPRERMDALARAIRSDQRDSVVAFFPRTGEWSWVRTTREPSTPRVVAVGAWRFPAEQTLRAIGEGGPVCGSMEPFQAGIGPFEESFGVQMGMEGSRNGKSGWRRVGGTRFVPPDAPARSPIFVEWRREGERWVVASFGDQMVELPRTRRVYPGEVQRTPQPPTPARNAADAEWFAGYRPLVLDGYGYHKYRPPRTIDAAQLEQVGVKDGVPVYAPRGQARAPDVIYVLSGPGTYQPYETPHGRSWTCR
jgi:hypothetical protein